MYEQLVLDVSDVMAALDAMVAAAPQKSDRPMAMAIVDAHGDLMGFMRMDGTPPNSMQYAVKKAYTSSRMRSDLRDFVVRLKERGGTVADYGDSQIVAAAGGGVVIARSSDGAILGGIGVSGGRAEEDDEVARVGLEALSL